VVALAVTAALGAAPAPAQFMTGRGIQRAAEQQAGALSAREMLDRVGFDQRLGAALPLAAMFRDEQGRELPLGALFGDRPVVLALVYYRCPLLCKLIERGAASAAKPLALRPGSDYDFVFVSFDSADTVERAAERKAVAVADYGRPETADGWHFLTGDETAIGALADAVGFRWATDPVTGQFAHAAGLVVATPDGRVSRYLYGAEYAPRDLQLALTESSAGTIGGPVAKLMLLCFRYDSALGKYTAVSLLSMRVAAALTLVALATYFLVWHRRARRAGGRLASGGLA
jgi:protein SCO1/2